VRPARSGAPTTPPPSRFERGLDRQACAAARKTHFRGRALPEDPLGELIERQVLGLVRQQDPAALHEDDVLGHAGQDLLEELLDEQDADALGLQLIEDRRQKAAALAPLGRMGVPPDIASTALFFTSDLSSYITGQTLLVDGGVLMQDPYEPL
jgi:hypothetical protein